MVSKHHVAVNEQFNYDSGSEDTHGLSICLVNVYNFWLSSFLAKYCRVNLGSYLGHNKDHQGTSLWMCRVCLMMGLFLSPYSDSQGLSWARDVVKGNRSDPNNLFGWDKIRLNLPGNPSYSPTILNESKVWVGAQNLAVYFTTYVDDSRVEAGSENEAVRASRRVGSI